MGRQITAVSTSKLGSAFVSFSSCGEVSFKGRVAGTNNVRHVRKVIFIFVRLAKYHNNQSVFMIYPIVSK